MQNNDSPLKNFFRQKWVRIILAGNVLLVLILLGVIIYHATKVSTITFNIAPVNATISINGNTNFANGTYKITPGTYEIQISHKDLETKTFTVDIAPHHTTTLAAFLKGTNDNFEFYELKTNEPSYDKLKEIASTNHNITTDQDTSAETFISDYHYKYQKLQDLLPINYTEYGLDPDSQSGESLKYDITIRQSRSDRCNKSLCIEALMLFSDNQDLVKTLLAKKGIEIDDYEVIYKTY